MPKMYANIPKRMGRASASSLSASELRTIVRRLGFVALKAHETMMSNLLADKKASLAEALNDALKPIVDALLHFELPEGEDDGELHG